MISRIWLCGWGGENVKLIPGFRTQTSRSMIYKITALHSFCGFCFSVTASSSALVAFPFYLLLRPLSLVKLPRVHCSWEWNFHAQEIPGVFFWCTLTWLLPLSSLPPNSVQCVLLPALTPLPHSYPVARQEDEALSELLTIIISIYCFQAFHFAPFFMSPSCPLYILVWLFCYFLQQLFELVKSGTFICIPSGLKNVPRTNLKYCQKSLKIYFMHSFSFFFNWKMPPYFPPFIC